MLIGVTFLTVISDVLLSDNSYKKYIKSIIGIFILTIIVQGMFGLKDIKIDYSVIDKIEKQVEDNMYVLEEDIKNEMIKICDIMRNSEFYSKLGVSVPNGLL